MAYMYMYMYMYCMMYTTCKGLKPQIVQYTMYMYRSQSAEAYECGSVMSLQVASSTLFIVKKMKKGQVHVQVYMYTLPKMLSYIYQYQVIPQPYSY